MDRRVCVGYWLAVLACGAIFISCETLTGNGGRIAANGGTGNRYAGGGGGGRIAVAYRPAAQRRIARPCVVFSTVGGVNTTPAPGAFGHVGSLCFPVGRAPGTVLPQTGRLVGVGPTTKPSQNLTVAYWMPWRMNKPIVRVKKDLYRRRTRPKAAAMASRICVGAKRELMETQSVEARDDVPTEKRARWSTDNGRTWSALVPLPPALSRPKGIEVWQGGGAKCYDPRAGVLVDVWLRQIQVGNIWGGGICNCFTYYRLSRDHGRTWTTPKQLRYEHGTEFDPDDPLKPEFLKRNQAYFGSNILRHTGGTLIHCVAHANDPTDPTNDKRTWKLASLCFIGRWDARAKDYAWTPGRCVRIAPDVSSRGLMEPEAAELTDGRVLVIWRGSNTKTTPGRKWFSVSTDGGMTLERVQELKYDDGTSFYSPSSFHRMIRHSVTGKLYWIGNITHVPPSGNSPRYPLVIAEVDETTPALKRDTVTVIDDRQPDQGFGLQLSNFSLIEDRETHELVLFLTTYGEEPGQANWMNADAYKYTLALPSAR